MEGERERGGKQRRSGEDGCGKTKNMCVRTERDADNINLIGHRHLPSPSPSFCVFAPLEPSKKPPGSPCLSPTLLSASFSSPSSVFLPHIGEEVLRLTFLVFSI